MAAVFPTTSPLWSPLRRWVALWLCLFAFVGSARAEVPPSLVGQPVVEVRVTGPVARQTSPRVVGIPLGAPLDRALLRQAVLRLVDSGHWADVQLHLEPTSEGVRIVAALVPRLFLERIDVVGNETFDDVEIRRELQVVPGDQIEANELAPMELRLREMYGEHGYFGPRIRLRLRDTNDPSQKVLWVSIEEREPTRIQALRFSGDQPPRRVDLWDAMDLEEGDILDTRKVDEARRRGEEFLRERGWLEARIGEATPATGQHGIALTYPLHLGHHFQVRLRGYRPLHRDAVRDVLDVEAERLQRASIEAIADRVRDLYRRHGFVDARAEVVVLALPPRDIEEQTEIELPPEAILEVRIEPGQRTEVVARSYPGARHFSQSFLQEQFEAFLEERLGSESPIQPIDDDTASRLVSDPNRGHRLAPAPIVVDPGRVYYEPAYEAAATHVQQLYEADGYLGAEVGPVELQRLDGGRAFVVLPVSEGPRTFLHEVRIRGNHKILSQQLLRASGLTRDMPFSYLALERAEDALEERYKEEGFFFVEVENEVRFSADRTRADIVFLVRERYPVSIGETVIAGADSTREGLIRSVAALESGALLTPATLRQAQERLMALGVFGGVNVQAQDPEVPARVKAVVITVSERLPQYLDFRVGFSTAQGARFGFEYGIRNLFGTALSLSIGGQVGYQFFFLDDIVERRFSELTLAERLEWRISPSLTLPFIGLRNVRATLGASFQHENERNFSVDKLKFVDLSFTWRPLRSFTAVFSGALEGNNIDLFEGEDYDDLLAGTTNPRLRNLIRVPEGRTTVVAAETVLSLDLRDNPFTPHSGFFASASVEWAKTVFSEELIVGGQPEQFESNHLRMRLAASGYVPIGDKVVFATQLQVGRVFHLSPESETYPNRQFFLGGVDTLRGYLQDALIPQDLAEAIEADPNLLTAAVVQGGDVFMVIRAELRFPIFGSLRGGAFIDLGNSWNEPGVFDLLKLRPTAGLGLRIATPVGPIALDYGILLQPRAYLNERFGSFHFSIGLF